MPMSRTWRVRVRRRPGRVAPAVDGGTLAQVAVDVGVVLVERRREGAGAGAVALGDEEDVVVVLGLEHGQQRGPPRAADRSGTDKPSYAYVLYGLVASLRSVGVGGNR